MPLKANRKVAPSFEHKKRGDYGQVASLELEPATVRKVYLEQVEFPLVLVKQVFKNEDGSEGVLYLVSKDRLGMEVFRPRLGVVIGTNREFRDAVQRQKLASRYPDLEVVTYYDVLSHAQRRMALIRRA